MARTTPKPRVTGNDLPDAEPQPVNPLLPDPEPVQEPVAPELPDPEPASPASPTPTDTAQLDGLVRTGRTSRVGQSAVLLGTPAQPAPATAPRAGTGAAKAGSKAATGYPIQPVAAGKVRADAAQAKAAGYVMAKRTAHPTSSDAVGTVRWFAAQPGAGKLPDLSVGSTFETHVRSNRLPAGTWEVIAAHPAGATRAMQVNRLYPLEPAAS